jgi:hypothetical protein
MFRCALPKLIIIVLLMYISVGPFNALANDSFAPTPAWTNELSYQKSKRESEDTAVSYMLYDNQVNLAKQQKQSYVHVAIKVNNQRGISDISQLVVSYFPAYETFKFHSLNVIRNGKVIDLGSSVEVKHFQNEDALKNKQYLEKFTALAVLTDIRVDDIVEYSYSHTGSNPVLGAAHFGFGSLNFDIPVSTLRFRLLANKDTDVNFRTVNSDQVVTQKSLTNLTEYAITDTDVQAVKLEDYAPSWHPTYAWVEYSEYDTWDDVRNWAETLYSGIQEVPKDMIAIVESLKTDDKSQTAAKATQWIQENIRYFGVEFGENSHMPSSPAETFARRYGDCKDKSVLLIAALGHLGIEAYPAFVSTTLKRSLKDMLPSPGTFNHVIVHFKIDDIDYWVDPTMTSQRGKLIDMSFPDYELSLVADGSDLGLTAMTPVDQKQQMANVVIAEQLTIGSKQSSAQLDIITRYSGWKAEQMRYYIDSVGSKTATQQYIDYYSKYYKEVSESGPLTIEDDGDENNLAMLESYHIASLLEPSNTHNVLTVTASSIIDSLWLPTVRNRQTPFETIPLIEITHTTEILIQDSNALIWSEAIGEEQIKNPWFDYIRQVSKQDTGIIVNHNFKSLQHIVPADDFAEYVRDLEALEKILNYSFRLTSNTQKRKQRVNELVKGLLKKGVK